MEEGEKVMNFEVTKITTPERIEWNYEELKAEIAERVQHYETLVYTDETIKEAKADRANLNKLKKALCLSVRFRRITYRQPLQTAHASWLPW